jgi:hypothetical protein
MELNGKGQALTLGRHRQGIKSVAAPLFVPHRAGGGLSLGSPGTFKVRNEQEAPFVQENQVRPEAGGLFLSGATRPASRVQWRCRCADRPAARASDNSTPSLARDTTRHWDGSEGETLARPPWRYAATSTIRFGSPWLARRALKLASDEFSARPRAMTAAPAWVGRVSLLALSPGRAAPNATLTSAPPPRPRNRGNHFASPPQVNGLTPPLFQLVCCCSGSHTPKHNYLRVYVPFFL